MPSLFHEPSPARRPEVSAMASLSMASLGSEVGTSMKYCAADGTLTSILPKRLADPPAVRRVPSRAERPHQPNHLNV